jgi:hypothetical protein
MSKPVELRTASKAKVASKRPKTVTVKILSTNEGAKKRVFALDANSASFGDDFLYVFKSNVKLARKKSREGRAAADAAKRAG